MNRNKHLQHRYGLTPEDYEKLLAAQDYKCAVCGCDERTRTGRRFPVDHDHKTGAVRGILCADCNKALGLAHDNIDILSSMIVYLERYKMWKDN